jgi:hypothetical protein
LFQADVSCTQIGQARRAIALGMCALKASLGELNTFLVAAHANRHRPVGQIWIDADDRTTGGGICVTRGTTKTHCRKHQEH